MSRRNVFSRQSTKAGFAAVLVLLVAGYAAAAPVSPPTSVTATALSSSQIRLNWADSNPNESSYLVERSLSSGSGFAQIASLAANATTFTNTGLAAGTTYYYRVRATSKNGAFSTYSNVASARTTSTGTVPAAPSNAASSSPSSSQITISWTDNSTNETGFKVERAPASAGPWTYIGATAATGYGDSGLAAGTTYFYRVQAYNASGNSAYSNTTSSTTQGGTGVPAAPGSASATVVSSSQINVGWADTSGNETGFKIERSTSTAPWAQVATVGANVTSYASTGLAASTTYSFRVRAYNTSGDSGYSNTASATTSAGGTWRRGAYLWSTHFGGTLASHSAFPVGIAVDSTGASIVLGYMSGQANFGGGLLTSAGGTDVYLAKYAANGAFQWAQRFGGTGTDRGKGVAIDSSGNILITGLFGGTVSFGGTALVGTSASGFVAKYSPSGAHVWSRRLTTGTGSVDEGRAVGVDGSGNVIVGAGFNFTADFGAGPWTAGAADMVIAKYTSAGAYMWAKRFGGASDEFIQGIAVDATTGEIATTGYFLGSLSLGGGTISSAGGNDAFIAKYSSTGAHVWSGRWGSTGEDKGASIDIDALGNVAVTGLFTNNVDFGGGPLTNTGGSESGDIFLVKLSPSGIHLWSKGFGSSLTLKEVANGVAFDSAGNVLLTGSIVALTAPYTVDFGGGALTGDGWYNSFIAKFGPSGSHIWSKRYLAGGANSDGRAIAADSSGNALTVGNYDSSINFGSLNLTSPGGTDTYLVKLGP